MKFLDWKPIKWFIGLPMKTRIISAVVAGTVVVGSGVGIGIAVSNTNETKTEPTQIEQTYEQYVIYAQAEGQTPLSYEDWLATIKGEQGETGPEGPQGEQGISGVGIVSIAKTTTEGNVDTYTITLSDGNTATFTVTNGTNGKDGVNGEDGQDGKDGVDGTNGTNGEKGEDGISITSADINDNGELILSFSKGNPINLGKVVGTNGTNGINGEKGEDGISITGAEINDNGELILSFSKGNPVNLGKVVGTNGTNGTNGEKGEDGISITGAEINDNGELVLSFSKGNPVNLGKVVGTNGSNGTNGKDGKSAYQLYKANYGYDGTEEEWLLDLANNRLGVVDTYTVTFNPNNGEETFTQTVTSGKKAQMPTAPEKAGYSFMGWYIDGEKWVFNGYTVTEDITLTAKWNNHGIVSVADGITLQEDTLSLTVRNAQTSIDFSQKITVDEGCVWKLYQDEACLQEYPWMNVPTLTEGENTVYVMVTYGVSHFTKYTVEIYRNPILDCKFIANGETYVTERREETQAVNAPAKSPEKEHYDFSHWAVNGTQVTFPYVIHDETEFTAVFTPTVYAINYVLDKGAFEDEYPTSYTIEDEITLVEPIRLDYLFKGWYDNAEFTGDLVTTLTVGNHGDKTYYAKWEQITDATQFTVNLQYNGGEEVEQSGLFFVRGDLPYELSLNDSYKNDCAFGGWYMDESCTQPLQALAEGKNYTIYAKWLNASEGFTYQLSSDEAYYEIDSYAGTDVNVVCAEYHNNLPVKAINSSVFLGSSMETVILPKHLMSIADNVFKNCSKLTTLDIPDSVTLIGSHAFYNCVRLTSLIIPDFVTEIEEYTFTSCVSLTDITIGDNVTAIGDNAFLYCESLNNVVLPNAVTYIGINAFKECNLLTDVIIGNNVTTIGDNAFNNCYSISNLILGNKVNTIGEKAFYNCSSLISIGIPDSVQSLGSSVFGYCSNLESVVVGGNVSLIDENAFYYCSNLKSVVIGDSVTSIGQYAFYNCDSLTSVVIPDSVTSIGYGAFLYCGNLTSVVIGDNVWSISSLAFKDCYNLATVTMGNSISLIGDDSFKGCKSLTSIDLPDSINSIGSRAFEGCAFTSITLPLNLRYMDWPPFSGDGLIVYCEAESAPSDWRHWRTGKEYVIWDCNNNDIAEDGYVYIMEQGVRYALKGVNAIVAYQSPYITTANIPAVITYQGAEYNVTSIRDYAFDGCGDLVSVIIPDSVTTIGCGAFRDCSGLTSVYYKDAESDWAKITIASDNDNLKNAARYYYSENAPKLNAEGTAYDGNYWHYDTDGVTPVVWAYTTEE